MSFLYGGARPTNTDTVRDFQRKVASNARGVERELARMDQREAALQRELAGCAKDGGGTRLDIATAKAREIVRLRAHRGKLVTVKEHMTGLAQQLQTVQATGRIQDIVVTTGRMLQTLNGRFDAGSMALMLAEYERQNAQMAMKQELVDDALESGFEADGEQEDCNEAVAGVLSAAGLDVAARLASGRSGDRLEADETELANRLEKLRTA
jgi:charged multivesicular body protein 2A